MRKPRRQVWIVVQDGSGDREASQINPLIAWWSITSYIRETVLITYLKEVELEQGLAQNVSGPALASQYPQLSYWDQLFCYCQSV